MRKSSLARDVHAPFAALLAVIAIALSGSGCQSRARNGSEDAVVSDLPTAVPSVVVATDSSLASVPGAAPTPTVTPGSMDGDVASTLMDEEPQSDLPVLGWSFWLGRSSSGSTTTIYDAFTRATGGSGNLADMIAPGGHHGEVSTIDESAIARLQVLNPRGSLLSFRRDRFRYRGYLQPVEADTRCERPVLISDYNGTLSPIFSRSNEELNGSHSELIPARDAAVQALDNFLRTSNASIWILSNFGNGVYGAFREDLPLALTRRVLAIQNELSELPPSSPQHPRQLRGAMPAIGAPKWERLSRVLSENHCVLGVFSEEPQKEGAMAAALGLRYFQISAESNAEAARSWSRHIETMRHELGERRRDLGAQSPQLAR